MNPFTTATADLAAKSSVRVLIVEDEGIIATDIEERVRQLGYEPLAVVESGEEAVRVALALRPDVILMDIRLKGTMDGIDAAARLRTAQVRAPVIFLTSHSDQGTLGRAGLSEPFGYLTKPFQERDLHATIEMALYRHRAEERLRKIERWLATTLNSIGDSVIATDTQGRITYLNPMAEMLTGWTLSEALARPWQSVFRVTRAGVGTALDDLVERAMEQGIVVNLDGDANLLTLAGRSVAVDDSVAPIRDETGKVTGCVIVFRDASERRALEEAMLKHNDQLADLVRERTGELVSSHRQLEANNARLESANKELETITYSVSHDLRAPLRTIHGFATMLEQEHGGALAEDGRRLVRVISESCVRTGLMIDGFLELVRLGRAPTRLEEVDMAGLVTGVVADLQAAGRCGRATVEVHPLPEVIGDSALLRQVWANLIENALKFSRGREHPRIDISGEDSRDGWTFHIRDNGVGFDPARAGKLFGIFQRLHREEDFPGYGVGLSTVQRIVVLHGGRIWADGVPDQGATFHFTVSANIRSSLP